MRTFWLDYAEDTKSTHSEHKAGEDSYAVNFYWRALKQICLGHFSWLLPLPAALWLKKIYDTAARTRRIQKLLNTIRIF